MANRVSLDIDPSIIEKNLMITNSDDTELETLFSKEEVKSKLIKPLPGFCIKIKTKDNDEKIFINVCHTDELPSPKNISEGALVELLQSDLRSDYRVPMSIGLCRTVSDKQGNPAKAYDVAISSEFLLKIEKSVLFKDFFVTLVLEAIEDKYDITLNRNSFALLKNKKCMGTLQLHRVQQREMDNKMNVQPKPLIQEIDSNNIKKNNIKIPSIQKREPIYRLIRQPSSGNIEKIIGEFKFPEIQSIQDLLLDVGEDRIILEAQKFGYSLDIFLPHLIHQEAVKAVFNKDSGLLKVDMPVSTSA